MQTDITEHIEWNLSQKPECECWGSSRCLMNASRAVPFVLQEVYLSARVLGRVGGSRCPFQDFQYIQGGMPNYAGAVAIPPSQYTHFPKRIEGMAGICICVGMYIGMCI